MNTLGCVHTDLQKQNLKYRLSDYTDQQPKLTQQFVCVQSDTGPTSTCFLWHWHHHKLNNSCDSTLQTHQLAATEQSDVWQDKPCMFRTTFFIPHKTLAPSPGECQGLTRRPFVLGYFYSCGNAKQQKKARESAAEACYPVVLWKSCGTEGTFQPVQLPGCVTHLKPPQDKSE